VVSFLLFERYALFKVSFEKIRYLFYVVLNHYLLRRMFGPKRNGVAGEWRKLYNGELHNFYSSPDIVSQIKSRRIRWVRQVERMVKGRNMYMVLVRKPKEKVHLKDQGVIGRMGLKWTLGRLAGGVEWIHLAQDRDRWWALVKRAMNLQFLVARN
jgi:hypothetical protein